jgi:hypothetical protein
MSIKTVYRPIYERKFADGSVHEVDHPEINFTTYQSAMEHGTYICEKANSTFSTNRVKYVAVFPLYGSTGEEARS